MVEEKKTFSQNVGRYSFEPALLVLEDGSHYFGRSLGASGETGGEVVFNTSMAGYQEILTDPSYKGQIVVMSYPQIGNYGVRDEDHESSSTYVEGFVVKEYTPAVWPDQKSDLNHFLKEHSVVSVEGLDTRAIVKRLRTKGSMRGIISSMDLNPERLHEKVLAVRDIGELNLVEGCSCKGPYDWNGFKASQEPGALRAVVYDFGAKRGILDSLSSLGIAVSVVPHDFPAEEVLKRHPNGVVLSNGPGDPERVKHAIEAARTLMYKVPLFGICLGHQILCLALEARIYKLKFGHHGGNHPVKDVGTGEVKITSQNHNYAADAESIEDRGAEVTHINLYDGTVEGMKHRGADLFGIQYHPEACPGPNDSHYLFRSFVSAMEEVAKTR